MLYFVELKTRPETEASFYLFKDLFVLCFFLKWKVKKEKKKDRRHLGAVISTDREENFRPIPFWLDTLLFASCSYSGHVKTQRKTQIKLRGYELSM